MPATYSEAIDQMSAVFKAAMDPTTYPVVWDDTPGDTPKTRTPWARHTIRHETGRQASLLGDLGKTRWERGGTIFLQLFDAPGAGMSRLRPLVSLVQAAYEGRATSGGIWFRNTRVNEIGVREGWRQINVLVDFTYDEVKTNIPTGP